MYMYNVGLGEGHLIFQMLTNQPQSRDATDRPCIFHLLDCEVKSMRYVAFGSLCKV